MSHLWGDVHGTSHAHELFAYVLLIVPEVGRSSAGFTISRLNSKPHSSSCPSPGKACCTRERVRRATRKQMTAGYARTKHSMPSLRLGIRQGKSARTLTSRPRGLTLVGTAQSGAAGTPDSLRIVGCKSWSFFVPTGTVKWQFEPVCRDQSRHERQRQTARGRGRQLRY